MKPLAHHPLPAFWSATFLFLAMTCLLVAVPAHAAPRSEMVTPSYKACDRRDKLAKAPTKPSEPAATPSTGAARVLTASAARCAAKASA